MNLKLNIGKQSGTFGRVNRIYHRLYCPSVLVSNKVKKETSLNWIINLTSVTAVAQCANKYMITHSPLRLITAFHCFADMHTIRQRHEGN